MFAPRNSSPETFAQRSRSHAWSSGGYRDISGRGGGVPSYEKKTTWPGSPTSRNTHLYASWLQTANKQHDIVGGRERERGGGGRFTDVHGDKRMRMAELFGGSRRRGSVRSGNGDSGLLNERGSLAQGGWTGGRVGPSAQAKTKADIKDDLPPPRKIMGDLMVPSIVQLTPPDDVSTSVPVAIEKLECIGSYTWSKTKYPTIVVPGSPREWLDRPFPFTVPFDDGIRMFHEDAYYMKQDSTLIPLFRAVDELAPGAAVSAVTSVVDWANVDFVTDRNNLRKLLRWVREPTVPTETSTPTTDPLTPTEIESEESAKSAATTTASDGWHSKQDFRIDLQLGGSKTVLMHRWAALERERVTPPKAGWRANFEREATMATRECENGGGHYRIVQYNLGGLKMVVRFEVDAFESEILKKKTTQIDTSKIANFDTAVPNTNEISPSDGVSAGSTVWESDVTKHAVSTAPQNLTVNDALAMWREPVNDAADWGDDTNTVATSARLADRPVWGVEDDPSAWGSQDDESWSRGPAHGKIDNSPFVAVPELKIIRSGTLLPQTTILEFATRSVRYADRINDEDIFLQMFLTQTPTHLIAVHQNGKFEKVIRQELASPDFAAIAEKEDIRRSVLRFVELLKELQKLVKTKGTDGRLSLVCEKGKLEVYGRMGKDGLVQAAELKRFNAV